MGKINDFLDSLTDFELEDLLPKFIELEKAIRLEIKLNEILDFYI